MSLNTTQNTPEIRKAGDWRARRQCEKARQLETAGDYEAARAALGGIWSVIGQQPDLENLPKDTQAEMLLRVGALSSRIGSARQISAAQEFAKDLLAKSQRLFEELSDRDKLSEAQRELALCYWREGAFDEGQVFFANALTNARVSEKSVASSS